MGEVCSIDGIDEKCMSRFANKTSRQEKS